MKKLFLILLSLILCVTLLNSCYLPYPGYPNYNNGNQSNNNGNLNTTPSETSYKAPSYDTPADYNDDPSVGAYYIEFSCNGGSSLNPIRAEKNSDSTIRNEPYTHREGYEFVGWYSSPDFAENSRIYFPYLITSSERWYAKWQEVRNYQNLHGNIDWSSYVVFDMREDRNLGIGQVITVPDYVTTIHLIGDYGANTAHIYNNLSFRVLPRNGNLQFVLENFAFSSVDGTPAISADGIDITVISQGTANMIKGHDGAAGKAGNNGADHQSDQATSGSNGENGKDGTIAVVCRDLLVSGNANIHFVGGNGGAGGVGGRGGNITSLKYTLIPSCGNGGHGGKGGKGVYSVYSSNLTVNSNHASFSSGSGGAGGAGGTGGSGMFEGFKWCHGGNGGNGGQGGNSQKPIYAKQIVNSSSYSEYQNDPGSGGKRGNAGIGNGNGYWGALDNHEGTHGSPGQPGIYE